MGGGGGEIYIEIVKALIYLKALSHLILTTIPSRGWCPFSDPQSLKADEGLA